MIEQYLRDLLARVQKGRIEIDQAVERLKDLPFESLGYAMIDHHRELRRGYPEAIFCEGKTVNQIKGIASRLIERSANILATRAGGEVYKALKEITDQVVYYDIARIAVIKPQQVQKTHIIILVITAGTADIPVSEEAAVTAKVMGNTVERLYDVGVAGIHRLLSHKEKLNKASVLIVIAGMDGVLPSVVGGLTKKTLIAVPTSVGYGASFGGLASLLTMLNSCASGVSVVNIDNGYGAAYCAAATDFKVILTDHEAHHHRNLRTIERIIEKSGLGDRVKELSKTIFCCLAEAEAKAHNLPIEQIHFH